MKVSIAYLLKTSLVQNRDDLERKRVGAKPKAVRTKYFTKNVCFARFYCSRQTMYK